MNYFAYILSKFLNCFCIPCYRYQWIDKCYIDVDELFYNKTKLIDCNVMSSHNSTIDDFQIIGASHIEILKEILNLNFRMIELDIFNDYCSHKPVVAHGRNSHNLQVTSAISFEKCCNIIKDYAWRNTNMPLFLNLEIVTSNNNTIKQVNRILFNLFKDRILFNFYKPLKDFTLSELKNKIIIMPNKPLLVQAKYKLENFSESCNLLNINFDELTRVYPNNLLLSRNLDYYKFKRCNFICMNVSYKDKKLRKYLEFFKASNGIMPK